MAQRVPAQGSLRLAPFAIACALFASCEHKDGPQQPEPRHVDTAALGAAELKDAVLQECHGQLHGELDRVSADVTLTDGTELQVFAELPDRLRVQQKGSEPEVLTGDDAFLLAAGYRATTASESERQRLHALRSLLDLALLGPLYRAERCERDGAALRLFLRGEQTYELTLREGTLLPQRLSGPLGTMDFRAFRPTFAWWIPEQVAFEPLGNCKLYFTGHALTWQPAFFSPPGAEPRPAKTATFLPGFSREDRPAVPKTARNRAMQWVVVADPGDWNARADLYCQHHTVIAAQDQQDAGFATFFTENGRPMMAVPFRQQKSGPAFVVPPGWSLRELPENDVLVVFPPAGGTLQERIARGEQQLREALQASGHTAAGPVMAQPYLHLEDGTPDPKKIDSATLRMSVVPR
jgi:hypothetical protein